MPRGRLNISTPTGNLGDDHTVRLDYDDVPLKEVKRQCKILCKLHKLEGFKIWRSSRNHYHVMFDKWVTWKKNGQALASYAMLNHHKRSMERYMVMQMRKGLSVFRISKKGNKKPPVPVYEEGSQSHRIAAFLRLNAEFQPPVLDLQEQYRKRKRKIATAVRVTA